MEFTSTVLYQQEMAYYNVLTNDGLTFKARLLSQDGDQAFFPKEIILQRVNHQWVGNADEDLIHYLTFDISRMVKLEE